MADAARKLTADAAREAMKRVGEWRRDPQAAVACPACGTPGLVVHDRSARPHAEWYALRCAACGLDDAIQIALGSPPLGGV